MILVADNAHCHHKRGIGSFASLSKKKLINLMKDHHVDCIDLPTTTDAKNDLLNLENHPNYPDI